MVDIVIYLLINKIGQSGDKKSELKYFWRKYFLDDFIHYVLHDILLYVWCIVYDQIKIIYKYILTTNKSAIWNCTILYKCGKCD